MKFRSQIYSAFMFLLLAATGLAQNANPPIVRDIQVQFAGPATVSKERILTNMRTAIGKPYSETAVEEDIRSLYQMGSITNVRMFGEPMREGVRVVVVVQSKASVGQIVFNGVTRLKTAKLRKDISTKNGDALSESSLEQDRQKILDEYQKRGFTDTDVQYTVEMNEAQGTARVVFNVNEGGKTTVRAIYFDGNQAFTSKELRKVMKTKPHNFLSFLTKAGRLQNDQLDQDRTALVEFYQNHGYIDVEVGQPQIERGSGAEVNLVVGIKEGNQYRIGRVAVTGGEVFTADEIGSQLKTKEDAIFSPKTLRDDVKKIQDVYGARGYIDLQANAETSTGGADRINVAFKIDEGAQSYVERVNIVGNTRTKDKVIRRELALAPGDVYDTSLVEKSKERLANLNYFEKQGGVESYPSPGLEPGRQDLNIQVQEARTGSFNFGAGFSSIDNLLGFAEVQQSNFDITNWRNGFTGGGERFRTRVQYGTQRKDFVVSLVDPWFMDYQVAVGGELFYREASFVSSVYNQRNYGFDINARKPLGNFTTLRGEYRLEQISILDVNKDASLLIQQEAGDRVRSAISTGITYDTRDSLFLTRTGHRIDLGGFVAGGPLGGNTDVYGLTLEGSQYFHLPWDGIFFVNGEISAVNTWAGGDRVPIFDRLFLGGSSNLRGFSYRKVGPKDEDGEPIGGQSLARMTLEYTFPVIERVRGALFYDVGYVNSGAYDFAATSVNSDVGFGVRLDIPALGPVRLDYGIPLQSDHFNHSSGKFNFSIGYQF